MKTVSYKDRDGLIVVETYLDYIESYEEGNVPKQMIDVNGTLVDSDKLYEIIYKAETKATVREAIKEQEILDERIKQAPWYLKPYIIYVILAIFVVVYFTSLYFSNFNAISAILTLSIFFIVLIVLAIKSRQYGITGHYRDIIDNYEAERRKRFNRKNRWR